MSIHHRAMQDNIDDLVGTQLTVQEWNGTKSKRIGHEYDCVGKSVEAEQQVWRSLKCSTATEFRTPSSLSDHTSQAAIREKPIAAANSANIAASSSPSRINLFQVPVESRNEVPGMSRRASLDLELRRLEEEHAKIKRKFDSERVRFNEEYMLLEQTIRAGRMASSRTTGKRLQRLGSQKQETTPLVLPPKAISFHPSEQSPTSIDQDSHDQFVVPGTTTNFVNALSRDVPVGHSSSKKKMLIFLQTTIDFSNPRKGQHGEENANSESCLLHGAGFENKAQRTQFDAQVNKDCCHPALRLHSSFNIAELNKTVLGELLSKLHSSTGSNRRRQPNLFLEPETHRPQRVHLLKSRNKKRVRLKPTGQRFDIQQQIGSSKRRGQAYQLGTNSAVLLTKNQVTTARRNSSGLLSEPVFNDLRLSWYLLSTDQVEDDNRKSNFSPALPRRQQNITVRQSVRRNVNRPKVRCTWGECYAQQALHAPLSNKSHTPRHPERRVPYRSIRQWSALRPADDL